jgi:hypothetical protein
MKAATSLFKYGSAENVSLSEAELARLKEKFGESEALEWIETFSLQKAAHGYRYKSDYHAILSWHRKETRATGWPTTSTQLIAHGWKFSGTGRCHGCKAVIFWARTPSGKSLPLETVGENWRPHDCGAMRIER